MQITIKFLAHKTQSAFSGLYRPNYSEVQLISYCALVYKWIDACLIAAADAT